METSVIENLDLACATVNKSIVEHPSQELKKLITDALSVLEEQGVYALFLYLNTKKGETKNTESIWRGLENLLTSTPHQGPLITTQNRAPANMKPEHNTREAFLASIRDELAPDIEKLLLAQSLLRQTLVYARYHAQPGEKEDGS